MRGSESHEQVLCQATRGHRRTGIREAVADGALR